MNRKAFFDAVRKSLFAGEFTGAQVAGLDLILNEAERRKERLDNVAYALATTHWETASTIQPIREYGRGKGRKYGVATGPWKQVYYGRGYVQLTWIFNYEKASKKLGVDFVKNPDLVMDPKWAVKILFEGMTEGWFTGVSFKTFLDGIDESDAEDGREFTGARKIINGKDKAAQIAAMALKYEAALRAAEYGAIVTEHARIESTITPAVLPPVKTSWISTLFSIIAAIFKRNPK